MLARLRAYARTDEAQISLTVSWIWWLQSLLYHHTDVPDRWLFLVQLGGTPLTQWQHWSNVTFHLPW